jgi:hypothetical protein
MYGNNIMAWRNEIINNVMKYQWRNGVMAWRKLISNNGNINQ